MCKPMATSSATATETTAEPTSLVPDPDVVSPTNESASTAAPPANAPATMIRLNGSCGRCTATNSAAALHAPTSTHASTRPGPTTACDALAAPHTARPVATSA